MSKFRYCLQAFLVLSSLSSLAFAGERPTFNHCTADPRPDILPYGLTNWLTDYRQIYNRPRNIPGRIAHCIEPTSQEAMVWCEAKQMGLYDTCNHPPVYKKYKYAKPWEVLLSGPRPDFKKQNPLQSSSSYNASGSQKSPSDSQTRELSDSSSRSNAEPTSNIRY